MFITNNFSKDIILRTKATEILLSDLIDTHVIWIENHRQVAALVNIRNQLSSGHYLKLGMWDRVRKVHMSLFGAYRNFSRESYWEAWQGSSGRCREFVAEAHKRWNVQVPGYIYCWLVDIHARALRAQLGEIEIEDKVAPLLWLDRLGHRSRWSQFGQGSRVNAVDYGQLITFFRRFESVGEVDMLPIDTPERWQHQWVKRGLAIDSIPEELQPYLYQAGYSLEYNPV
jgi:hypothetical protein